MRVICAGGGIADIIRVARIWHRNRQHDDADKEDPRNHGRGQIGLFLILCVIVEIGTAIDVGLNCVCHVPREVFHAGFDVAVSVIAVGAVENLRADRIRQPVLETVSDLKPILAGVFHERVEYAVVLFGITRADTLRLLNRIVLDSLT